ncbi:hypothetical protein [Vibrio sp. PNB22_8_1]|uniref:hypothetical protein n=1 Tax=unclassified Vibrio TaxID=2614977 RepID=UPI00406A50E2
MNRKLIANKFMERYKDTSLTENVIVSLVTGFNSKIHTVSDTIKHLMHYYDMLSSNMDIIELYKLTNLQYEILLVKDFIINDSDFSNEYVEQQIDEQEKEQVDEQEQVDFLCKRLGCDCFSQSKIELLHIYNERLNGNNNDYQDELCATDNDLLIKNKISNLQDSERKFIVQFLNENLKSPKSKTNLRVALAMSIIVITAKNYSELKNLKISANDDGSEGIFLDSGVWRRRDYVPRNSYRRVKHSPIQAPITRNIDLPLPYVLINALKLYLGDQVSIKASNLSSVRKIWKVLKNNDPNDVILPGRKGAISLRRLLFLDLMESSDQEVAALILSQPTFAKRHHLYYLSHKVEKTVYLWSRSIKAIFKDSCLKASQIEPNNLYHGSECVIDIVNIRKIINLIFDSIEERKKIIKSLSKIKLIKFWNDIESLKSFIYLMNIAGREVKEIASRDEIITYSNSEPYISVLDKITPKNYKDRILPISELNVGFSIFSKKIQSRIEDRLGISADSRSQKNVGKFRYLKDDLNYVMLSSKLCLKQLFPNEEIPYNLPRQLVATYIREVDAGIYGKYGRLYLGHECDKYNNRCHKMLSVITDIPKMVNKVIDYVFDGLIRLKVKPKLSTSVDTSNAERLSSILRSEIYDTKFRSSVVEHINKRGDVDFLNNSHCIELKDDHLYIINDEIKVLIDDVYRTDTKLERDLCVTKDVNPLSFNYSHQILSSLSNNLSYSQYKELQDKSENGLNFDDVQSGLIERSEKYDELSSIYELISKFNDNKVTSHKKQYQLLRMLLLAIYLDLVLKIYQVMY